MNRYAYAFNDPVNHTDIDGLGGISDSNSKATQFFGEAAKFLATTNLVDHLQFYADVLGLKVPVKRYLGWANMGVGNSLALVFGKFHALGRGDYSGFGKMMGQEAVISAAIAASIISYSASSAALAPLVNAVISIRVPYYLTLIQNGDHDAAWKVHQQQMVGTFQGIVRGGLLDNLKPFKDWAVDGLFGDIIAWGKRTFTKDSPFGPPAPHSAGFGGIWVSYMNVLTTANPYCAIDWRMQATSLSPQSRLASGTGTLFGYGYEAAASR
jgi:hypothetical protein